MFPHSISLESLSLARHQVKSCRVCHLSLLLALRWLRDISATDVMYEVEIVQRVAPQNLATSLAYVDKT